MPDLNLAMLERQSVQDMPQVDPKSGAIESSFWGYSYQRSPYLDAWATRHRLRQLRWYDLNENNAAWQGGSAGLIKKLKATGHQLKGGRNLTNKFDDILRYAQFGAGFDTWQAMMWRDYLRYDIGAFSEIIAPGNPLRAPTGAVTGLAHLDSLYCFPTGDPEFPVVYYSRKGKLHVMHHTRIMHLIDNPYGDQDHPGWGFCALSRAISVAYRQILINQYIASNLDDKPSPGLMIANNMSKEDRDHMFATFRNEQGNDALPDWGKVAWFFNLKPDRPATIESVSFSRPPEKFDYPAYVQVNINELALALGVDKQELWELSGATGTAGQSAIQHAKSNGKAYGDMLASLEREINNKLLPDSLEFEWKVRDPYEAQEQASSAQIWGGVATTLAPLIGNQLAAEILASQVEAVANALFDENGQMTRLPDQDKKPADEQTEDITAEDAAPNSTAPGGAQTTAQDSTPNAKKDYEDTRSQFVLNLTDLFQAGNNGDTTRRRAGVVMRAQLSKLGRQAYEDGLKTGGVEDSLDEDDKATLAVWLAEQSIFVTKFLDELYSAGLTDKEIGARAQAWANVSLQSAYYDGLQSSDKNGMYAFVGTDGLESCDQCKTLKTQVHRMKDWTRKQLRPGVDISSFDCHGFQCDHFLDKTTGRASGNWLN